VVEQVAARTLQAPVREVNGAQEGFDLELTQAMADAGLTWAQQLSDTTKRLIVEDIPDSQNPGWTRRDGSEYIGPKPVYDATGWFEPGTRNRVFFSRSFAWALDPVPDVMSRARDASEQVKRAARGAADTMRDQDVPRLDASELGASLRYIGQYVGREALSRARSFQFGYDDKSNFDEVLSDFAPYSYWTVSHMMQMLGWLAKNPQAFAAMALAIREWDESNKDLGRYDRWALPVRLRQENGNLVLYKPTQLLPYATSALGQFIDQSDDEESILRALFNVFGVSLHFPLELAMQATQTRTPENPLTKWWTGGKEGGSRVRALIPQLEIIRQLSGGKIDIEGGKVFGVEGPDFREWIYGVERPNADFYATSMELARQVFAKQITELDAKRALLSLKDGAPNDLYNRAMEVALHDKGIFSLIRWAGAPLTNITAEQQRIDKLFDQADLIKDSKAKGAFYDKNPDLSVAASAGKSTTAEELRRSIKIDETPKYVGTTPEQAARYDEAARIFFDTYAATPGTAAVKGRAADAALAKAGYSKKEFDDGQAKRNPEYSRLFGGDAAAKAVTDAQKRSAEFAARGPFTPFTPRTGTGTGTGTARVPAADFAANQAIFAQAKALRDAGNVNGANRLMAENWDLLVSRGWKPTGTKPTYRNDEQESALAQKRAISAQYEQIKATQGQRAASDWYRTQSATLARLDAVIAGRAAPAPTAVGAGVPSRAPSAPFVPRGGGGGGGGGGAPRRPATPAPPTLRHQFENDTDTVLLRSYLTGGLKVRPNSDYIRRLRLRYPLDTPMELSDDLWLDAARRLLGVGTLAAV
jgi:hypothetical protein